MFFLRRKRQHQQGGEGGLHDLARAQDSVIVSKQKKRVGAAPLTAVVVQSGCGGWRRAWLRVCLLPVLCMPLPVAGLPGAAAWT
jgi:hypothetical protein